MPPEYEYVMNGYRFTRENLEIMTYPGYKEEDVALLSALTDSSAKALPGFIVDVYGIRTRISSLWPEARALGGKKIGHPMPGNFHWEAIEWIGLMRSVLSATNQFRIMELGAGWGPAIVSGAVLARLRGITDIRLTGVEGDPHHYRFMVQHVRDNGFNPSDHRLHHAAVAAEDGQAQWPVTSDSSADYGFRPIEDDGDYMDRNFERTQTVKMLAMSSLVRSENVWDLIHIDVQGAETEICRAAISDLNDRVKRIMIGTHSRKTEGDLLELFAGKDWILENEKPAKFTFWPKAKSLEAMTTVDGTQIWRNPRIAA